MVINDRNWSATDTVTIPTVEYIDKTQALERICYDCNDWSCTKKWPCADYAAIRDIPPANVKPVIRGKWLARHYVEGNLDMTVCSECGNEYSYDAETGEGAEDYYNFCPNCGAAMTEEAMKILARRNGERKE